MAETMTYLNSHSRENIQPNGQDPHDHDINPHMATIIPMHPNRETKEIVRVLSAAGASLQFIANETHLHPDDLTRYYQVDLDQGPEEANARVAQTFLHMATSGDYPQMTIAWMKMKAGWNDSNSTPEADEADLQASKDKLASLLKTRPDVLKQLALAPLTSKSQ
jgi:hypothetical protein